MVLDPLKWLKETSGTKKNKELKKKWTFAQKESSKDFIKERVYLFLGLRIIWYYEFLGVKRYLFQHRKLGERWSFFTIYETCMMS